MKLRRQSAIITNLFIVILLLIFAACTFNEPVLPSWLTVWELPIPDINFEMSEVIDNEYIFADTTDQGIPILNISIKDTVDKEGISRKDLSIKPDPDTLSKSISDISVASPGSETTDPYTIQDLLPIPFQVGDTINVPELIIPLPTQYLNFSTFRYAYVSSGKISLIFNNNTFLSIKDSLQIDVYDDSINQFIGTAYFSAINPYSSKAADDSINLDDKFISHRIRLDIQVPIQAEVGHPVTTQDVSGYVNTEITISDLTVSKATAEIPAQTIFESGAKSIEDKENRVKEAEIDEGQIVFYVENQMEVEASVLITLPNFEKNGIPFTQSKLIQKQSVESSVINLAGYRMINHLIPMSYIDSVYYNISVETTPSNGMVTISDHDSVIVSFFSDSIFFNMFDGEIDTVEVDMDTVQRKDIFDYQGFDGEISLEDLQMELSLFNEVGIPIDIEVNISGERRDPDTQVLEKSRSLDPVYIHLDPGESGFPDSTTVILNALNSKLVDLMRILPTNILMSGNATIMGEGRVTVNDSIWGEYSISSPMNVFVDSIPPYESEIDTLDSLDPDVQKAINENFQEAKLQLNVTNGLPLAADVVLIFSTDTTDFFSIDTSDTSKLIIRDFRFESAEVGADGYVSSPNQGQINFRLDENEIKIFAKDTVFMGSKIIFPEINKHMKFRSTDYFDIDGAVQLKVLMNTD